MGLSERPAFEQIAAWIGLLVCAALLHAGPARAAGGIELASAAPAGAAKKPVSPKPPLAFYSYGAQKQAAGPVLDLRGAFPDVIPVAASRQDVRTVEAGPLDLNMSTAVVTEAPAKADWLERERTGKPYKVNGKRYVPSQSPGFSETGTASWYGPEMLGQATASGEPFDPEAITAAHPTLPIPSLAQVTNLENGREVIVRINDRGPFSKGRVIDVSKKTAEVLGFQRDGEARVNVRYLGPAPRRVDAKGAPIEAPAAPAMAPETAPEPPPIPVPAGPEASWVGQGGYVVQLGAFSDIANAYRARDKASEVGQVSIQPVRLAGGELFRVRVGGWASRAEAEAARAAAAQLGFSNAVIAHID